MKTAVEHAAAAGCWESVARSMQTSIRIYLANLGHETSLNWQAGRDLDAERDRIVGDYMGGLK